MLTLIPYYIAGVLVKQGWEASDWALEHKAQGYKGWWADQKYEVVKKGFMHIFLCPAWASGLLTDVVAAGIGAVSGLAGSSEAAPMAIPIIPATTIMAAYMLDSIGKPIMKRLKRKEADV